MSHQAINAAIETANTISEAKALIFGLTPRRTDEKTTIGNVVDPGSDTKLAITKSSNDKVKASSQP